MTLAQAPKVRGLHVGMSLDELSAIFLGLTSYQEVNRALERARQHDYGVASFIIQPSLYPSKERFAGINYYYVTLFDERIVRMGVQYASPGAWPAGPRWERVEDFVDKVAAAFGLPQSGAWDAGDDSQSKVLSCQGFEILANTRNHEAGLEIVTKGHIEQAKERRRAAEEKNRREFKP